MDGATARPAKKSQVRARPDAVTLLSGYLILLLAIPAQLVVGPLGSAGSPALIFGLFLLMVWLVWRIARPSRVRDPRIAVRLALLCLVAAVLLSYADSMLRPMDSAVQNSADRSMLIIASWSGVALVAIDGIPDRQRLDVLLRRMVFGVGLVAALGVVQFVTRTSYTDLLDLPGLSPLSDLGVTMSRGAFARPAGTALHPIEFGVAIAAILPLALHYAICDRHRPPLIRWFPVVAIALAVPASVSRSAVLGAAFVMVLLLPTWPKHQRRAGYAGLAAVVLFLFLAVPGIIGQFRDMFTNVETDTSTLSRTGSYDLALEFAARSPLVGRGFGTFLPEYRILDNQYLLLLIEVGAVGLAAFMALLASSAWTAITVRRGSRDPITRDLAQSLLAAVAVPTLNFAFFDGLSFPIASGLLFLVIGVVGAFARVTPPAPPGGE